MAEGRFDYLQWFPDGNRAARYRPPVAADPTVLTVETYARGVVGASESAAACPAVTRADAGEALEAHPARLRRETAG